MVPFPITATNRELSDKVVEQTTKLDCEYCNPVQCSWIMKEDCSCLKDIVLLVWSRVPACIVLIFFAKLCKINLEKQDHF